MVSVPSVNIGSPVGWAAAELPSTENKGAESMIKAGLYGTAITQQKQEIAKTKKEELDKKKLEELRGFGVDRWSNKDRKGMATVINEMAVISPEAAKNFKDALFNLDKTDAFRAGMALYAAAASPTDKAQVSALKQAKDIFSMTSVPFAEGTQGMIDTPYGPERDKQMMDAVAALQGMGILPAPKDVFGATGSEAKAPHVVNSKIMDDGTTIGIMSDKSTFVKTAGGEEYYGKEADDLIAQSQKYTTALTGIRKRTEEKSKATEKNYQATIDRGKTSADALYDAVEAVELLGRVKTGGWEGFKIYMKNKFGISSGDEAKLSTILAENIFKQIKPTFGGNPSVQEGQWLRETKARIGQSTEGNLAVINDMIDKYINNMDRARAEAAAQYPPDEETIRYIDTAKKNVLDKFGGMRGTPNAPKTTPPQTTPPAPQGNATFQRQTPSALPPKMPSMGYNENANVQRAQVLNAAQRMGIRNPDPLKLRYSKSTGKYGYKMPNGEIIVIEMPNM